MAPSIELDSALIRTGKNLEVATHIRQLLLKYPPLDVCNALLAATDGETITPYTFSIFLSAAKSDDCVVACLQQTYSVFARREAIKQYGRAWADPARWHDAWEAIGRTPGILKYLSVASVDEVKLFFIALGSCNRGTIKPKEREAAIEELLKAMYPGLFPDAPFKNTAKRPLEGYAISLVRACSANFVRELLDEGFENHLYAECSKSQLIKAHGSLLRDYTVHKLFKNTSKFLPEDVCVYLPMFVSREPSDTSKEAKFSASMTFSEKLLEQRLKQPDVAWPPQVPENSIYFSLLSRCVRKKVAKQRQHEIFDLGLRLLEQKPNLKNHFLTGGQDYFFWGQIAEYWGKDPSRWEDLVVKGLRLGLGGTEKTIGDGFIKFANRSEIKNDRTWSLLRLFCLHVPKDGVDIDSSNDLKPLSKQRWDIQVFRRLPDEKAIRLLKALIRVNQAFDFFKAGSHATILSQQTLYDQRNFNALLFLTQLQAQSTDSSQQDEAQRRAQDAVADLKNKSASSREQSERAQYAKAAGFFSIASGSLNVFGEHVAWLQRFVRDPLTVKVIFSQEAIASDEASNLLSGISDSSTEASSLSEISGAVAKANEILLSLHEHKKIAKREPSFQTYDWTAVSTLLNAAIKVRIAKAGKLQKKLNAADGELYSAIWSQTIAMLSQVGAESLRGIQWDMQNLMTSLPPKTLATTTQAMLETDNKYRAVKAEGKEAEDESRIIEQLTYSCLLALAKGDKPSLAEDIIVRTIIDRPDASSWHRQMLSISFFKRLPAQNAEQLLLGFAKAIGEKLEEQSYIRIGEAANTPSFVKVTTVKYLAQLLQDAQFLSPEAAIDVLLELFKVATHPDIRYATLESMLSTLNTLCASELLGPVTSITEIKSPLIQKILAALDTVIPVVGSINERRPPREQDWEEAREDLTKLPEPSGNPSQKPLWTALVNATHSSSMLKPYFIEKLLLPACRVSVEEHRKWLALFLKKHEAGFTVDKLPALPVSPVITSALLWSFHTLATQDVLKGLDEYTRLLLAPPAFIYHFNAKLKHDEEKSNKADVKHWLSLFDRPINYALQDGTLRLINLFHRAWKPSELPTNAHGITLQQCQAVTLSHIRILLDNYDRNIESWNTVIERLRHPNGSSADFNRWNADCRPVLEQVLKAIEAKRTPEWLRDPNRKPTVLPSARKPALWLLPYPKPGSATAKTTTQIAAFATKLVAFVHGELAPRTRGAGVDKLVADVMTVSGKLENNERVRVAISLGSFARDDVEDQVEEAVRVDLAKRFLDQGREALKKDDVLRGEVREMVGQWQRSLVEEIREKVLDWRTHDVGLWNAVFGKKED